jgi:hypothetical protein
MLQQTLMVISGFGSACPEYSITGMVLFKGNFAYHRG